jgi:cobalamin synthase
MAFLAPLAALLGIELDGLIERLRTSAVALAVTALFGVITIVFLLVAANVALTDWVGPAYAPLIIAGIALVLALIVWFATRAAEQRRQRLVAEKRRSTDTTALITTAAVTALPLIFRNPAMRTIAIPAGALLAYYMLKRQGDAKKEVDRGR